MNTQQQSAFNAVTVDRANVFLTGPAGYGKSYVIQEIVRWANTNQVRIGVTAATGAAALLIRGRTVHSFLGIGLATQEASTIADHVKTKAKPTYNRLCQLHLLVIDEISMISDELFDKISRYLQLIRNDRRPFGGVQVVICGDFHQLPSVDGDFAFYAKEWKRADLQTCMLHVNMRQKNDMVFQDILARARIGVLQNEDITLLEEQKSKEFEHGIIPTRLYSRRVDVDRINKDALASLLCMKKRNKQYATKLSHHPKTAAWAKAQGIPDNLHVCEGCQVVVTWNVSQDTGIVNGSRGIVEHVYDESVGIRVKDGRLVLIEYVRVEMEDDTCVWASFMPLTLAYALTIHKCQGMTLDAAEMDLGRSVFEFGQAYTALSRVKNIESLRIIDIVKRAFQAHPDVVQFYKTISLKEI